MRADGAYLETVLTGADTADLERAFDALAFGDSIG
ncbi:hypothetical protein Micau_2922 [Micromonospora aurantiaca ATCC 27029]|nr:hypothetical protein Micau_2922 [Micromonospora aurantiaca ATCC 27029]